MGRDSFVLVLVPAVAMFVAGIVEASQVPATLVLKAGDTVGASTVSTLNPPFTDANGKVGFLGTMADADRFIWHDTGPVWFNSDETVEVLTGGEGTMGIGNNAEFIYSPSISGSDGVWGQNGQIAVENVQAPDLPRGWNSTFHSRPQMSDDGTAHWVAGFDDTGGTATKGRVLYSQAPGGSPLVVIRSDDVIDGQVIDRPSGVDFDYQFSGDGLHHASVILVDTGSTTNDGRVYIDGSFVAAETAPSGSGDNWDNFDIVSINNNGNYIFTGDTDGATTSDEFVAYNGAIVVREGDTLDGVLLASGFALRAASINDLDQVAHMWGGTAGEHLFFGDASNLAASVELLAVGDTIDVDGDTIADYLITDFNASSGIAPGLDLAEDGVVYLEVDIEPVGGGTAIEAIIGVATAAAPCLVGDVTGDGSVDMSDVGPFVTVLLDPDNATAAQRCAADVNADLSVDGNDIGPFLVELLP